MRRSDTASDQLQPAYARARYRRSSNSDTPSAKATSRRRYIRHTPAGRNMRLPQGCSMASPITTDLGQGVSHAQPCVVLRRFARKVRARGISGEEFNQYLYQSLHSTGRATEREDSVRYRRQAVTMAVSSGGTMTCPSTDGSPCCAHTQTGSQVTGHVRSPDVSLDRSRSRRLSSFAPVA